MMSIELRFLWLRNYYCAKRNNVNGKLKRIYKAQNIFFSFLLAFSLLLFLSFFLFFFSFCFFF
jgi:hypothetical protein